MAKLYECVECTKKYTDANAPKNLVCNDKDCPGQGMLGLLVEIEPPGPGPDTLTEAGLCVLLMDASGSMGDPAFVGDNKRPTMFDLNFVRSLPNLSGHEQNGTLSKRQLVSMAAALAIFDLKDITKIESAYICAIKFDHRQAQMFTKSIANIIKEFSTTKNLAEYFLKELCLMNGATDITSSLKMAHNFIDKFKNTNMPGMGNYTPMYHTQYFNSLNKSISVPNIRALVYTDGVHMTEYGTLSNPFKKEELDLLLGAYIGASSEEGCNLLQQILSKCPIHDTQPQFFLMDSPEKIAGLKNLFKMASGTSGFCPECSKKEEKQDK